MKSGAGKANGIDIIGDWSPYVVEYLSLKHEISVLSELNEKIPEIFERLVSDKKPRVDVLLENLIDKTNVQNKERILEIIDELKKEIKTMNKTKELLKKAQKETKVKDSSSLFLKIDDRTEIGRLVWELFEARYYPKRFNTFIRNMSLVYLVSTFENFLQKIIEITLKEKPQALVTSQKSITYEELLRFGNIEDVVAQLAEKEAQIVNEGMERVQRYFKIKFKVNIAELVDWNEFNECFYRRNILIHNSGFPNEFYRLKTGYKGKNRELFVSHNYLKRSMSLFNEIAFKISIFFTHKYKSGIKGAINIS